MKAKHLFTNVFLLILFSSGCSGKINIDTFNTVLGPDQSPNNNIITSESNKAVPPMKTPRAFHTATLLDDGRIMVLGGVLSDFSPTNTTEIYDPLSNEWELSTPMTDARAYHGATLLNDGKLLVVGGDLSNSSAAFDPENNSWSLKASLPNSRTMFSIVTLKNGKVLVMGGTEDGTTPLSTVDIYEPTNNTWTSGPSLNVARKNTSAVLLPNGKVMVIGGIDINNSFLAIPEIFDPSTNIWTLGAPMSSPRAGNISMLLKNGKVLVSGGTEDMSTSKSSEIYDPLNNNWSKNEDHLYFNIYSTNVALADGRAIITGGYNLAEEEIVKKVETYLPNQNAWTTFERVMFDLRSNFSATLLKNGQVLAVGGSFGLFNSPLSDAAIYNVQTNTWKKIASTISPVLGASLSTLSDGKVLLMGGYRNDLREEDKSASAEIYDPENNIWTAVNPMQDIRVHHASVTLNNGRVLVIGGNKDSDTYATAEVYNPVTNSWNYVANLGISPKETYNAAKLNDGRILVMAGNGVEASSVALIYDPTNNSWSPAAPMSSEPTRQHFFLGTLGDGRVFATGGTIQDWASCTTSSEIYDPMTNSWSPSAPLNNPKFYSGKAFFNGVVLPDGKVIIMGGVGTNAAVTAFLLDQDINIYNPTNNNWE